MKAVTFSLKKAIVCSVGFQTVPIGQFFHQSAQRENRHTLLFTSSGKPSTSAPGTLVLWHLHQLWGFCARAIGTHGVPTLHSCNWRLSFFLFFLPASAWSASGFPKQHRCTASRNQTKTKENGRKRTKTNESTNRTKPRPPPEPPPTHL